MTQRDSALSILSDSAAQLSWLWWWWWGFGMNVCWKLTGKAVYQQGYNRKAERQARVVKIKKGKKNLAALPPAFDKAIEDSP